MTGRHLHVTVQNVAKLDGTPGKAQIARWVAAAAGPDARGEITVRIVDEAESADLNTRYRDRAGPTNVLAFGGDADLPAIDGELPPLGDLVVCAAVVLREAAEQRKPAAAHWCHIVIHGSLHLFGYDHGSELQAAVMETRERELLAGFKIADPYAPID